MKLRLTALLAATAALALPMSAQAIAYSFKATLRGSNESLPNATTGSGVATVSYDDKGTVSTTDDPYIFLMSASGLTGPASGFHIHAPAAAGATGPIVVDLQSAFVGSGATNDAMLVGGITVSAPNATFPAPMPPATA